MGGGSGPNPMRLESTCMHAALFVLLPRFQRKSEFAGLGRAVVPNLFDIKQFGDPHMTEIVLLVSTV